MTKSDDRAKVLNAYPKSVVHLRKQVAENRFGLVLGAGVSLNFGVPLWPKLVANIALDPQIQGKTLLSGEVAKRKTLPYQTEMLFERFRGKALKKLHSGMSELDKQSHITAAWLELCAKYIYAGVSEKLDAPLKKHPYFLSMLPLVQRSQLTVTFNFDDFLERSLSLKRKKNEPGKGYEIVTDPWPQFRRSDSVIYHVHGVVPNQAKLMELPVDRFVFSEAAYSTQYIGSRGHDSSFLLTHFARNTCLFVGCALEDELRNVLMRGAQFNPGNYHYYIHWIPTDKGGPSEAQRKLISDTNFKIYNLITLFLTSEKIKALFELIDNERVADDDLADIATSNGVGLKYNYYLTGPLGVGKSTTANLLRSLNVLDEWLEARPQVLAKAWDELTPHEQKVSDNWIVEQFQKKNDALRRVKSAISIVDRPPLDPLAFTKPEDRPKKAKSLLDKICPKRKWGIEPGVVILMKGDPDILSARVRARGRKDYSAERLIKMEAAILELYQGQGVHLIDTKNLSILDVTKKVAEIIHRDTYISFDLTAALKAHESKRVAKS